MSTVPVKSDLVPTAAGRTGHYVLDPAHSRLGFVARHAMITKVRGAFADVRGAGYFDAAEPSNSSLEVVIAAASIDTGNADRDDHLRSEDFFDVSRHPSITFVSTAIDRTSDTDYRIHGELTIKGVSHHVAVDVELSGTAVDPDGDVRLGLSGTASINRKDWGLTWNVPLDAGGLLVSERIVLELDISAVRTDG